MEEELGSLEKDPLAEAVKVYVAEGKTLEEVEVNLRKLEVGESMRLWKFVILMV